MTSGLAELRSRIIRPVHYRAVTRLNEALKARDVEKITPLLSPRVSVVIDSGRTDAPDTRVLTGVRNSAAILLHGTELGARGSLEVRSVNGQAGLVMRRAGRSPALICLDFSQGLVSLIWVRLNAYERRHGNEILIG